MAHQRNIYKAKERQSYVLYFYGGGEEESVSTVVTQDNLISTLWCSLGRSDS